LKLKRAANRFQIEKQYENMQLSVDILKKMDRSVIEEYIRSKLPDDTVGGIK